MVEDFEYLESVRKMLDSIDRFLSEETNDARSALWGVLTALRGPDDDDWQLKKDTTARIRAAAFPRTELGAARYGVNGNYSYAHGAMYANPSLPECSFQLPSNLEGHFLSHVRDAAVVLNKMGRFTVESKVEGMS